MYETCVRYQGMLKIKFNLQYFIYFYFYRTDNSVKNHYNSTIKRLAERGLFRKEAESIQLDIQQFGEGEVQLII